MRINIDFATHLVGRLVNFEQRHVVAAGDVDQHALCALHRHIVEQRVGDRSLGGLERAVLTLAFALAHHGRAHAGHHGPHVSEVEIDQARHDHQVRDAAHAGIENLVGHREGVGEGRLVVGDAEQVLVRDDQQGVDFGAQVDNALLGNHHAALALEVERLGNHADGEDLLLLRDTRDDRGSARPRAAAHAGGDEAHMRPVQDLLDLVSGFLGRFRADIRIGACAEARRLADTELDLDRRLRPRQGLRIGVRDHEFDTLEARVDHVVDGVAARAAHADHDYPGSQFNGHCHPRSARLPTAPRTAPGKVTR